MQSAVLPYRFYLLNRLQDAAAVQDKDASAAIQALFAETGLEPILNVRTKRRMERADNHEAWGELV